MAKLSVIPTDLINKLLDLALLSACSERDNQVCSEVAMLLDETPAEVVYDEQVYEMFTVCAPLLDLTDFSRDEKGVFTHPYTLEAFNRYAGMMVRHGQDALALKDMPNDFFHAMGAPYASFKPKAETVLGFERAFDLLTRLDGSMPLSQVMVWFREFLSGSMDAAVGLVAAEGEWIAVDSGRPPEGVFVLCTMDDWEPAILSAQPAPIKIGYFENGVAKLFGASWTPTHWRLLPPSLFVHSKLQESANTSGSWH